ncbi:hypothetical protein [Mesorhizobium sp. Mes31]|uniref:hypothetical protein n=1 Tax=Mesorhizobium sp. Mes31 TaxID=2926017 RepID=UPI0021187E8D|nr:hypothetical protein [Mesorhizobium sp. Mes31]
MKKEAHGKLALLVLRYFNSVDFIGNFSAHPVAKLVWVAANIAFCVGAHLILPRFLLDAWISSLTFVAGFGLLISIIYPRVLLLQVDWILRRRVSKSRSGLIIRRAPGGWLVTMLQLLFTKRAFDHIFSQVVNDGREEYWEALSSGHKWLANWRQVQLYLSLGIAIVSWIGVSALKNAIKMWKAG